LVVVPAESVAIAPKLWVEPATGCLVPAAAQVIERAGGDVSLGFVVCGGNVTRRDVRSWFDRLL